MPKTDIRFRFVSFESPWEAGHGGIETFESAVDLFTVLSLVLIIASFVFGIQQVETSRFEKTAEMSFRQVAKGTGTAFGIPEEYLAVIVKKETGHEFITFVKGGEEPRVIYRSSQSELLRKALERERHELEKAKKIFLVLMREKPEDYSPLFQKVEEWMATHYSKQPISVCFHSE